jgi:hypothetical protein
MNPRFCPSIILLYIVASVAALFGRYERECILSSLQNEGMLEGRASRPAVGQIEPENGYADGPIPIALHANGRELRQPALSREISWARYGTNREQTAGAAVLGDRRSFHVNQILTMTTALSRAPSASAHSLVRRSFSRGIANDIRSTLRTARPIP